VSEFVFCPFCFLPVCKVSNDKKGRPYASCQGCMSRTFFKREDAYAIFLNLSNEAKAKAEPELLARCAKTLGLVPAPRVTAVPAVVPTSKSQEIKA